MHRSLTTRRAGGRVGAAAGIVAAALACTSAQGKTTGEPFFKFESMKLPIGTKAIDGQVELRMAWIPAGEKVGITETVIVPVTATDTPAVVAANAAAELRKMDYKIADSFTIGTDGGIVTLTRKAGVKALSPGGGTRPKDRTGQVPLKAGAGIDPVLGEASWMIEDAGLADYRGDFMIGLEGLEFTTPTYDETTGFPKTGEEVFGDLLEQLRGYYGDRASLSDGVLRVADVTTGDPFTTPGLDIGATYFSTDPDFTGFACMTIPSPAGLSVLGAAGLTAVRRRR